MVSVFLYAELNALIMALLSDEVLFAIQLSVITATLATITCLVVSIPAAYALSRLNFPGKDLVDAVLNVPIVMPPVALGASLLIFLSTPLGSMIELWSVKFIYQVQGIVLAQFVVVSALAIRVLKSTFDDIDPEYEYVARTLGYNKFQAFLRVTLPLSKSGLLSAAIIAWARAIGEFGATVTLAGATRMKTETLPIAIYLSLATADVTKAAAVVVILVGIAIAVLVVAQKTVGRGPVL